MPNNYIVVESEQRLRPTLYLIAADSYSDVEQRIRAEVHLRGNTYNIFALRVVAQPAHVKPFPGSMLGREGEVGPFDPVEHHMYMFGSEVEKMPLEQMKERVQRIQDYLAAKLQSREQQEVPHAE